MNQYRKWQGSACRHHPNMDKLSREELETWNERAAIMEFDGKIERATAERMAMDEVLRKRQVPGRQEIAIAGDLRGRHDVL